MRSISSSGPFRSPHTRAAGGMSRGRPLSEVAQMTESPPPPPDHDPAPASTAWGMPAATSAAVVPLQRPGLITAAGFEITYPAAEGVRA